MTVRHIGGSEDWYIIDLDRSDGERPPWQHRGMWLHGPNVEAHIEWSLLGKYNFGYGFELGRNGGESDVGLNLYAGPLASIYMRLRAPWTAWARVSKERDPDNWYTARHTGVRLFSGEGCYFEFTIEDRDGHWSSGQPWWRHWRFDKHKILGRIQSERVETESGETGIPLPEGVYPATWTRQEITNRYTSTLGRLRDLIYGPRRHAYVDLKIEGGIPAEGKGENSWDCGMDGLFGCSGTTLEEAIGNAVRSTLRDRKRNGGPHDLTRPMTVTEAEQRHVG